MSDPIHYMTIRALAAEIEARRLSPVAVTEHMLARIAALDGRLKAYATVMAESALAEARQAEAEIAAGRYRGKLHGVPVAVKDLCYTKGVRTMGGLKVRADFVPDFDATVVERLRAAGAVLLGKINLTEGAMAGYNPDFPVPENPWRASHWSGASSSGSGAATAAGLAFATLGSDTGGSIRHPAAVCGTVGLKPTYGLVSRHGVLDLAQTLDHVGPLTRSAVDAGIVTQAIAGHDPRDPTSLPDPVPDLLAGVGRSVRGLRIGFDARYASEDLAPDFAAGIAAARDVMARLGAEIVPVAMPARLREYMEAWQVLCTAEAADAHRAFFPARADDYGPWFRQWLEIGNRHTAMDYAAAHILRTECNGEMRRIMADIDLFLCPSTAREAFPVSPEVSYGPIPADRSAWNGRFTWPSDYAGLPTLSLPCGLSEAGLPLSLQFIGHHQSEALLVQAGAAYESATDWHTLHPPGWD
ncbi:MAG: amidase [Alphaproteobacteria bacterium]|nr:amidase [Alphaproteobacteria bacterium]MCB9929878.1 amidase [Alphaproteobacteria bacterium]